MYNILYHQKQQDRVSLVHKMYLCVDNLHITGGRTGIGSSIASNSGASISKTAFLIIDGVYSP